MERIETMAMDDGDSDDGDGDDGNGDGCEDDDVHTTAPSQRIYPGFTRGHCSDSTRCTLFV